MRLVTPLVASLAVAPFAWADNVAITNPGFEADVITGGAFVVLQPLGWDRYDPSGLIDQTGNAVGVIRPLPGTEYFPGGTPEGDNAAIVYLGGNVNGAAGLQQTLAHTFQANTRYTLSVDVGNIASGTSLPGSSGGAGNFFDLDGFPGYRIELLAGNVAIAVDDNSLVGAIPEGEFRTASFGITLDAASPWIGQAVTIRLINLDLPGSASAPNIEVDFDNVRLVTTPVPEPSTWALVLAGFALLLQRARRVWSRRIG
ncbi:MAG: PEP-CTERM sorting domain-containing protein [Burkholderiales bacterium]